MSDTKDVHAAIERLERENAELNGLILATGVILTQLLQGMTLRELNPQGAAKAADIEAIIAHIRVVVRERTGIDLEPEVQVMGVETMS